MKERDKWKVSEERHYGYYHMTMPSGGIVGKFAYKDHADLAAAAPVMLAALKEMQHISKNFCYVCDARGHEEPLSESFKHSTACLLITAAIAKAEGMIK